MVDYQKPQRIGQMLGWGDNPFYKSFDANRNAVIQGFAGIGSDPMNPGGGFARGFANGSMLDMANQKDAEAEAKEQEAKNATVEWLQSQGYDDLVQMAQATGDIGAAWSEGLKRSQPAGSSLTADMQNYLFAQENPGFADFIGGGSGGAPQIVEIFDPQTGQPVKGYMQGTEFVPVGGAKQASARDNPMNATIQKEIFEADEAVMAGESVVNALTRALELNDQAYDGPFSEQRAYGSALFGDAGGQATLELKNVVTAQALDSLKAIFGGMPTEGERKILLEIQGSVDQPKAVREQIYRRAQEAANRRIEANRQKAAALRSGSYFDAGYGQQPSGGTLSNGVQWSIGQ